MHGEKFKPRVTFGFFDIIFAGRPRPIKFNHGDGVEIGAVGTVNVILILVALTHQRQLLGNFFQPAHDDELSGGTPFIQREMKRSDFPTVREALINRGWNFKNPRHQRRIKLGGNHIVVVELLQEQHRGLSKKTAVRTEGDGANGFRQSCQALQQKARDAITGISFAGPQEAVQKLFGLEEKSQQWMIAVVVLIMPPGAFLMSKSIFGCAVTINDG